MFIHILLTQLVKASESKKEEIQVDPGNQNILAAYSSFFENNTHNPDRSHAGMLKSLIFCVRIKTADNDQITYNSEKFPVKGSFLPIFEKLQQILTSKIPEIKTKYESLAPFIDIVGHELAQYMAGFRSTEFEYDGKKRQVYVVLCVALEKFEGEKNKSIETLIEQLIYVNPDLTNISLTYSENIAIFMLEKVNEILKTKSVKEDLEKSKLLENMNKKIDNVIILQYGDKEYDLKIMNNYYVAFLYYLEIAESLSPKKLERKLEPNLKVIQSHKKD